MQNRMTQELCENIELKSRSQSIVLLWGEMRYGRITVTNIYEANRCQTEDGSLVEVCSLVANQTKKQYDYFNFR